MEQKKSPQIDTWPWGQEQILWGYNPDHKYTFKVLQPKKGRAGCLSLQFHHEKSESWRVLKGIAVALVIVQGKVCVRVMKSGAVQNLPVGTIHRLLAASDDLMVLEPSTPDKHAADKTVPKDVVRLHCTLGRECAQPKNQEEATVVAQAIAETESIIAAIEAGLPVQEKNISLCEQLGGYQLL